MIGRRLAFMGVVSLYIAVTAHAQPTTAGSLQMSGEVQGSIALIFWQAPTGYQLSEGGAGTVIAIGAVSAYGTPDGPMPNRLLKGMDSDGFHVSTPFQIQVVQANLPSSS